MKQIDCYVKQGAETHARNNVRVLVRKKVKIDARRNARIQLKQIILI